VFDPERPPAIGAPGIFTGLRPGAILLGVVVDHLATLLASAALVAALAAREPGGELSEEALEALAATPEFLVASLVLGLACTALGAFVGARRAGCAFVRHGGWIAIGSALVALAGIAAGPPGPPPPLWLELAGFLLAVPAGILGGWLAGLRAASRAG
jgi:hypothetical protein